MYKRKMQYRAEDVKTLIEQRNAAMQEMQEITKTAETEKRALTEEEIGRFDAAEALVKSLDGAIDRIERARQLTLRASSNDPGPAGADPENDKAKLDERAFAAYIRGEVLAERANNLTLSDNGAVIPSSIANKIIQKVRDVCPLYSMSTRYNVAGSLSIPYYDEDTQKIEMAYANEFTDLESSAGKFKSIDLGGFLAGALSKISKSLANNSQFDIVSFTVNAMADAVARWIERELLNGTPSKIDGISKAKQIVTAAAQNAVTADELIDVQETIPDVYQADAIWIMNKKTRTAIRKLKDQDGNYILNRDVSAQWGYTLLGKPVYTSDSVSAMTAGKTAIAYGDMSGLAVKVSEDMSIEILREKFATQHALGVVAWIEIDSKIENEQKIAVLKMHA